MELAVQADLSESGTPLVKVGAETWMTGSNTPSGDGLPLLRTSTAAESGEASKRAGAAVISASNNKGAQESVVPRAKTKIGNAAEIRSAEVKVTRRAVDEAYRLPEGQLGLLLVNEQLAHEILVNPEFQARVQAE